jgi:bifunctional non-homologous end joining protein LigD
VTWEELRGLATPAQWHIGDGAEMVTRAGSKDLAGWGRAAQALPDF